MKTIGFWSVAIVAGLVLCGAATRAFALPDDQAQIKALEGRMIAAFKAKDVKRIMECYVPDQTLFAYDVNPPRQYVGAEAYRKDWQGFVDSFPGPISVEMSDLNVTTDGKVAFGRSMIHFVGTDRDGKKVDLTLRITDGYRKVKGKWLIAQEHTSVPVDLATGKPDFTSKP